VVEQSLEYRSPLYMIVVEQSLEYRSPLYMIVVEQSPRISLTTLYDIR